MGHRFSKEQATAAEAHDFTAGTTTTTTTTTPRTADRSSSALNRDAAAAAAHPKRATRESVAEAAAPATTTTTTASQQLSRTASVVRPTISVQINESAAAAAAAAAAATASPAAGASASPYVPLSGASSSSSAVGEASASPQQIVIEINWASIRPMEEEEEKQQQQQQHVPESLARSGALTLDANANVSGGGGADASEPQIVNVRVNRRISSASNELQPTTTTAVMSGRTTSASNNNNSRNDEVAEYCEVLAESSVHVERRRSAQTAAIGTVAAPAAAVAKQPRSGFRKAFSSIFVLHPSGRSRERSHSRSARKAARPLSLSATAPPAADTTAVRHSMGATSASAAPRNTHSALAAAGRPHALPSSTSHNNTSSTAGAQQQQQQQQQQLANVIIPVFIPANTTCSIHLMAAASGDADVSGSATDVASAAAHAQAAAAQLRSATANGGAQQLPAGPIVHSQADFVHYLVPDLERITNTSYYWGKIDRYEAERLLEGKPEGTFLLRDSAQEEYLFSVTFRKYGRSLHARIEQRGHKFSFDCHDPGVFTSSTVTGLLKHYRDPTCVMFFEPLLTIPLHRKTTFSLQQLCRATVASHITYDGIGELELPSRLKAYLKEYHYKQKLRVTLRFSTDVIACT